MRITVASMAQNPFIKSQPVKVKSKHKIIDKKEYHMFIYLILDSLPNDEESLKIRKVKVLIPSNDANIPRNCCQTRCPKPCPPQALPY